jgi:uncharacterized membrane protein YphA (DoxX/SURF4 family)
MSLSEPFAAPFLVGAGLLVVGGVTKIYRPDPAVRALEAAAVPARRVGVRLLGSFEVLVGAACLVAPGPAAAALLAVTYLAFAAFLVRAMRIPSARSCGCAGQRDAPPSILHIVLNALAAVSGAVATMSAPPGLASIVTRSPMFGLPLVLGLLACGYAAYAAAVYLPAAWGSYRPHEGHGEGTPNVFRLQPFRPSHEVHP